MLTPPTSSKKERSYFSSEWAVQKIKKTREKIAFFFM